jgi:hypothetical protein
VPTRQQRPWGLLALGHGHPGATAAAAGTGDPSLQVMRALRPACCHQATGATVAAVSTGEPSLQAAGVLKLDCWPRLWGEQFSGTATSLGEPSLQAAGVLRPDC